MTRKVAIVTGSNKGIGLEIVKSLCQKFDGDVFLCSRDENRGRHAVESLEQQGLKPRLAILAVDDAPSINSVKDMLVNEFGGLDILVNNAGISFLTEEPESLIDIAKETMKVNYYGARSVCDTLFPILRPGARVVNISSSAGMLKRIPGKELQERLSNPSLTRNEIDELIEDFYSAIRENRRQENGWPYSGYSSYVVSKVMLSALTWIHHKEFLHDSREDIVINAVHPGYVATDMTKGKGRLSPEEGAKSAVMCCLIPAGGKPRGQMIWEDGSVVDWYNDIRSSGASQNLSSN